MILFQLFFTIIRLFVGSLTALILFPLWIAITVATSPLRILDAHAHANLSGAVFNFFVKVVFLKFGKQNY